MPYTSKLSRYWRIVSNRERVTSQARSESRSFMSAVSMANGEPYFFAYSSRIVPEPKHTTDSTSPPASDSSGLTAWVA